MGNCCSFQETKNNKLFALKLPQGLEYLYYDNELGKFIHHTNINTWLYNIYSRSNWTNWIVYNDEIDKLGISHTKLGHSKGILTWSSSRIGWLCHSVPNFPSFFNGTSISEIEPSELIFGHNFQYIEIPFDNMLITNILQQLYIMKIHIYIETYSDEYTHFDKIVFKNINYFNILKISDDIIHVAKPPNLHSDIYSKIIGKDYSYIWKIQTRQNNHIIHEKSPNIIDIKNIKFENIEYTSYQDHSKWAVTDNEFYFIGDLDRMSSQIYRGGGGFICKDQQLAKCLQEIIIS
jgi:hypothetical protein